MTNNNISVVIATLGGVFLKQTIENLNSGSIKPFEILICIPKEFSYSVASYNISNVKIIETDVKGQVAQRIKGFFYAKSPYVLQLDDDIFLDNDCIKELLGFMQNHNEKIAVCPLLYENDSKKYHRFLIPSKNPTYLETLIFKIINGQRAYVPGIISKSGVNMGLPEFPGTFHNIEWMPGACVLHKKENLINFNYYPLKGKAYAEDLFHSQYLMANGVKLARAGKAKCYVDFSSTKVTFTGLFISFYAYLKIMIIFNNKFHFETFRLYPYIYFTIIKLFIKKFKYYYSKVI